MSSHARVGCNSPPAPTTAPRCWLHACSPHPPSPDAAVTAPPLTCRRIPTDWRAKEGDVWGSAAHLLAHPLVFAQPQQQGQPAGGPMAAAAAAVLLQVERDLGSAASSLPIPPAAPPPKVARACVRLAVALLTHPQPPQHPHSTAGADRGAAAAAAAAAALTTRAALKGLIGCVEEEREAVSNIGAAPGGWGGQDTGAEAGGGHRLLGWQLLRLLGEAAPQATSQQIQSLLQWDSECSGVVVGVQMGGRECGCGCGGGGGCGRG